MLKPVIDADSRFFWEKVQAKEFWLQQCTHCAAFIFYPRSICPYCFHDDLRWQKASGKGVIYSYTVARRPAGPAFAEKVPYIIALIDLKEGPRMMSHIEGSAPESVAIGQAVEVVFTEETQFIYPKFRITP